LAAVAKVADMEVYTLAVAVEVVNMAVVAARVKALVVS